MGQGFTVKCLAPEGGVGAPAVSERPHVFMGEVVLMKVPASPAILVSLACAETADTQPPASHNSPPTPLAWTSQASWETRRQPIVNTCLVPRLCPVLAILGS